MQEVGDFDPFIFKLVDESSRQVIESFALPSTSLSVLHQYDLLLSFGEHSKINLECCIWCHPDRASMLDILQQTPSMVMAEIALDAMRGFDDKASYSCFVEVMDLKDSLSKMTADKIKIDFNKPPLEWTHINQPAMTQKRCWLHFHAADCIDLQPLTLFCSDDVISSGEHQIVVKVYRESAGDHSPSLVGFMTIPIEQDANRSQRQFNVTLLDPKTKLSVSDKEIDLSVQLLNHENALAFVRFPTPSHDPQGDDQYQISLSSDPRHELIEDAKTYPEVINSELFQSIRSQLSFPRKRRIRKDAHGRRSTVNEEEDDDDDDESILHKKPTQRLFEAIERELTSKQNRIERLELEREEQAEQLSAAGNGLARLREEMVTMKRLNQRLSRRLQELMSADQHRFKHLDAVPAQQLRAMVVQYAGGHKAEKNKRRELERVNKLLVGKLKAAKEVHHKLVRIQGAAQEQAQEIRRLQRERMDMAEYRKTVLSQEEVIEKLEEMLSWAHGTIKALQTKLESGNVVSNRERELENEVMALHQENEELRKQIQLNGAVDANKVQAVMGDVERLKDELKQAQIRNDGLQQQLKAGAGLFGEQIAGLKIKIKQMQAEDDFEDAEVDDADLFTSMGSGGSAMLELSQLSDTLLDSVSISASHDSAAVPADI